jgi:hypothetical protein
MGQPHGTHRAFMRRLSFTLSTLLMAIIATLLVSGCSIFISTPRTATIHIQGLDNKYHEYIVALDDPATETSLDIQISKKYAVQLDFEWLWDSDDSPLLLDDNAIENTMPALTPWMLCKYRF